MNNAVVLDPFGRSEEERRALREKADAVNRYVLEHWHDRQWRREMAAELTMAVYRGFQHENLLNLLTTVENVGFNDRVIVKDVRGLRAFWVARGGAIHASTLEANTVEIPRDTIGFHVYELEDRVMTSFAETQADLVRLGVERLNAEVNRRAVKLFQAAIPPSSPYYSSGTSITLAMLNAAIRGVRESSANFQVTVVGRSTIMGQVLDAITGSTFAPSTNDQILARGILGVYQGATLVELRNFKDDANVSFWPGNELWVVGTDASKWAFYGGLMSKEWDENDNWYWHFAARQDAGFLVHRPNRLRRLVATSLAP